jgi:rhodanese-related sulfurtransferase
MFGSEPKSEVGKLTGLELKGKLDRSEAIAVLDVREDHERNYCAIPLPATTRDLHIPMNEIPGRLDELRESVGSGPLVIYCHHGVRSMSVADWLTRQGFGGIHNLTGGIDAWSMAVDPDVPRY